MVANGERFFTTINPKIPVKINSQGFYFYFIGTKSED